MSRQGTFVLGWLGLLLVVGCQAPVQAPVQQARHEGDRGAERRERGARAADSAIAGESQGFDYYLLNLSWSPEFCHSHPGAAQCAQHDAFVLHGLWPERMDGTYPENCGADEGRVDVRRYADLYPSPGLVVHEWRAHGTCSGLGAEGYFDAARRAKASVRVPSELSGLRESVMVAPERIVGMFAAANPGLPAGSVVVSCGNNYLSAVEVCLDKGLRPMRCGAVRSCRANVVRVAAP